MTTLHLLCGLPASGKTTLAKELEEKHAAVRLCPDEWILKLLPVDYPNEERDRLRGPVEAIQWDLATRLLSLGIDVIIEWGLWTKQERIALRDRARQLGAAARLYYLDVTLDELLERIEQRNADVPAGSFFVDPRELAEWHAIFEAPDADELAAYDSSWRSE